MGRIVNTPVLIIGVLVCVTAAALLVTNIIESQVAAIIGIVGIGLIGVAGVTGRKKGL